MPCSDSSSSISFHLDNQENFLSFDFAKITCGREITGETGLKQYCKGKGLDEIIRTPFTVVAKSLSVKDEETQFILFMEWDALRSAIAAYLGTDYQGIDRERCAVTAIEHGQEGIGVALVILPPKELPKILPCSLTSLNKNT